MGPALFYRARGAGGHVNAGRRRAALADFDAVRRLDDASLEARYNRAVALYRLGRHPEARDEIRGYLGRDPSSIWAERLRELEAKLGLGRYDAVDRKVELAAAAGNAAGPGGSREAVDLHHLRGNLLFYNGGDYYAAAAEYGAMLASAEASGAADLRARALAALAATQRGASRRFDDALANLAEVRRLGRAHHLAPWQGFAARGCYNSPMGRLARAIAAVALAVAPAPALEAAGDEGPVTWTASPPTFSIAPGETFRVRVHADIAGSWHLYSATQPAGGPIATRFTLGHGAPFRIGGPITQTPARIEHDPNFGIDTEFFAGSADFEVSLQALESATPGALTLPVQVVFQACNDRLCLPPQRVVLELPVRIAAPGQPPAAPRGDSDRPVVIRGKPAGGPGPAATGSEGVVPVGTSAELARARTRGFLPYLGLALSMGALSLVTPCVFPMIPITVSYFTRTAGSSRREGLVAAGVYCAGIVLTFTGLGLGLAALLGATGINQFAANPWLNLGIAALFLAFALNLFGLYQVSIPSALLTRLGRSGGSSHAGTLLMGLTFTLTSFTCTVPFVGTVLVATASGDWLWPAAGMLAFSLVFAAPFFALALLPGLVARLPRSGGWLGSVKATMGFLEAAAAMKFLSNADLVWGWGLFSRRTVLVVWLALALAAAAYLLGRLHLPHEAPVGGVGAVRLAGVLLVLAAGGTLLAGLFGAGLGELDAFLPPRTAGSLAVTGPRGRELSWHLALRPALEQARAERKPVLIDFTGYTCTNCRWMEANLLPLPAVAAELERFVRVQLYTDGTGPEHADNQRYQRERFGTVALPLYAVVDADGATLGTFPGMTRDAGEFVRFLQGIPRPAALGQRSTKTTIMSVTTAACPRRVGSG